MGHTPTEYFPVHRPPVTERELLWYRLERAGFAHTDPFFSDLIRACDQVAGDEARLEDSRGIYEARLAALDVAEENGVNQ